MTPERWNQIEKIYHSALEREPSQRTAYLQEACQDDEELRREVESLLAHPKVAESFIESAALEGVTQVMVENRTQSWVGQQIGAYKIVSLLGAGGMGEVYRAVDIRLNRTVAIKFLLSHLSARPDLRKRFEREARSISNLNHPHICTLYDIGEHDGCDFLVMEYLEGKTLAQQLKEGPLPIDQVLRYALQIGDALAQAHAQGVIHRDLKPGNIMLTTRGAKLLDFGLAKRTGGAGAPRTFIDARGSARPTESLTEEGMILGTLEYMAPEQVEGKETDARTDIFALGVIIYEMATGKKAFEGGSKASLIVAILTSEPPAITTIEPLTPPALERVIVRCLKKDPDERWQSARDLTSELEWIAKGLASSGTSAPPVSRLKPEVLEDPISKPASEAAGIEPSKSVPDSRGLAFDKKLQSWLASRRWTGVLLVVSLALVAGLALWLRLPPAVPKVLGYTKITHDSRIQFEPRLVTDGPRLYFTDFSKLQEGYVQILQVSTAGGELSPVRTELPNPDILDISPDGSELLARSFAFEVNYMFDSPLWVLPLPSGPPRRLGDLSGHAATWSPDGQQIAFAREKDLYVAKSDGTQARKVVTLEGHAFWLSWAPGGRRLSFTLRNDLGDYLWETFLDGTNLRRLFPGWGVTVLGNWTPTGKYFIFSGARNLDDRQGAIWARKEKGNFFNNANLEPVRLSSGPMPMGGGIPSRDGKKIFAFGELIRVELVRYDSKIRSFVPYLGGISAEMLHFSKDGDWVTYVTNPEGSLWRSKTDGSQRQQLTFPPMIALVPHWSPDRLWIAFAGGYAQKPSKIYVISADGGIPQQLMPSEGPEFDPMWFPDGKRLLFDHGEDIPSILEIQWIDLETKRVSTVPESKGLGGSRLSPDGRYITAVRFDSKDKDKPRPLLLFDFETQTWSKLIEGIQVSPARCWSMDSKYFYFPNSSKKRTIYRVRVADRKLEEVASIADFQQARGLMEASWFGLTPDDSPLVVRDLSSSDIYALDWEAP